jgi:hypothetical protein
MSPVKSKYDAGIVHAHADQMRLGGGDAGKAY